MLGRFEKEVLNFKKEKAKAEAKAEDGF